MKVVSDVLVLFTMMAVPYLLAWSRLNRTRAKAALYEGAQRTAGIR